MQTTLTSVKRSQAIDLLKTIAIFGVLTVHTAAAGFNKPIGSFGWVSSLLWDSLVRGVPIFLMCSGALMLDPEKELPLKKLYLKNILHILVALFIWAAVYKIYHLIDTGFSAAGLFQGMKEVVLFKQEFHLYYLQIILLFYVFLPVMRLFVKYADKKQLQYFLILWFILGIVYPTVKGFWPFTLLSGIPAQWLMNMTYASIGYGVLGYYIKKYPARRVWIYPILYAAGIIFVFCGTWYMSAKQGSLYEVFMEGMSAGVCLMGAGIFGILTTSKITLRKFGAGITRYISKASFCIYLTHVFFLYKFKDYNITIDILPGVISVPLLAAANMACCIVVYYVLSKIPLIKKWLI